MNNPKEIGLKSGVEMEPIQIEDVIFEKVK
jgi:hypothetical protein